jgi:regulator of CtrA degradation
MIESSIFLEKLYKETLQLLNEARSYITYAERTNEKLPSGERLRVSYETLRITARLSQVMTWLLTEKAVMSGEIPADQARGEGFAIYGGEFCEEETTPEEMEEVPAGLRDLLERTRSLYQRALRLEEMLKAAAVPVQTE